MGAVWMKEIIYFFIDHLNNTRRNLDDDIMDNTL